MTDIEQKAQAMVNGVLEERGIRGFCIFNRQTGAVEEALCRAIEQHEAFRQEVSDAVEMALKNYPPNFLREHLHQFIIPKPEPDPLVDVLLEMDLSSDPEDGQHDAKWLRIKLDALGFEIREKGQ